MARKRISFADYAWLRMDDPHNLMVITGLMTFDAPLDYERFKATVEHSWLRFRRFRQRIALPVFQFMQPYWEDDPDFNLDQHLIRVQLPAPAGQKELQDLISTLMSTELEYTRPLWEFYLVDNFGKGGALVGRLHHSMADGIALMQVLLSMAETDPNRPVSVQNQEALKDGKPPGGEPIQTSNANLLASDFQWSTSKLWEEAKLILGDPSHARVRTRQAIGIAASVGKLVLRWPDPKTDFKGPLGIAKRAAWSDPLSLDEVKHMRKAFHCTVNDVLLTAVAGAMGRYIEMRGEPSIDLTIHGFIPVNLRPVELDEELGNRFGLVFVSLPIGIADPVDTVAQGTAKYGSAQSFFRAGCHIWDHQPARRRSTPGPGAGGRLLRYQRHDRDYECPRPPAAALPGRSADRHGYGLGAANRKDRFWGQLDQLQPEGLAGDRHG